MGWIFDRTAQGQGYATEAGMAALGWADEVLKPDSIPAIIDLENIPSMRLAERLGFVRQADAVYRDQPIALFRRARTD
jgi:RimJ/RimL family protein N-acetyltransferase